MASFSCCSTRLLTLLSLFLPMLLLLLLRSHTVAMPATSSSVSSSFGIASGENNDNGNNVNVNEEDEDEEEEEEYVLDSPILNHNNSGGGLIKRSNSRFLVSIIKKGRRCNPKTGNICNGVPANKGKIFLVCCKRHCRNVLADWNNCGRCGHRCKLNEKCCMGKCVDVLFNHNNCGKCNRKCFPFESCQYGICGYD